VISASADDRTAEEKGEVPLKTDRFMINKSRYDSIDSYLSTGGSKYNDIPLVYDQEIFQRLRDGVSTFSCAVEYFLLWLDIFVYISYVMLNIYFLIISILFQFCLLGLFLMISFRY